MIFLIKSKPKIEKTPHWKLLKSPLRKHWENDSQKPVKHQLCRPLRKSHWPKKWMSCELRTKSWATNWSSWNSIMAGKKLWWNSNRSFFRTKLMSRTNKWMNRRRAGPRNMKIKSLSLAKICRTRCETPLKNVTDLKRSTTISDKLTKSWNATSPCYSRMVTVNEQYLKRSSDTRRRRLVRSSCWRTKKLSSWRNKVWWI